MSLGSTALVSSETSPAARLPAVLCVDLDGTLVRSDTLLELLLRATKSNLLRTLAALLPLLFSRAKFKAALARLATIDAAFLPYEEKLVDYLRLQKQEGRKIVLATASSESVANAIAQHVGVFDEVLSSTEHVNLKGSTKAALLEERYGRSKFSYAGNERSDLPVWERAGAAVLVAVPRAIAARVTVPVEAIFAGEGFLAALLRALRVHQWAKNVLVFLPLITANALTESSSLLLATATFFCFSGVASGVYLLNDLFDLDADRRHASKRYRPLASGRLPIAWAVFLGPALMVAGLTAAVLIDTSLGICLAIYIVVTTAYSAVLKTRPLVDVFTLASLYTLRVIAGGVVTDHLPSIWLLSFSGFLFLSLAFLKRYVELSNLRGAGTKDAARRGYLAVEDIAMFVLGIASAFSAAIVLSLYVELSIGRQGFAHPQFIWGMVPLALFWLCRVWLAAFRGYVHADPIVYAARDWVSQLVVGAAAILYALAAWPLF